VSGVERRAHLLVGNLEHPLIEQLPGVGPLFWLFSPPVLYGSRLLALVSSLAPVPPFVRSAAARDALEP